MIELIIILLLLFGPLSIFGLIGAWLWPHGYMPSWYDDFVSYMSACILLGGGCWIFIHSSINTEIHLTYEAPITELNRTFTDDGAVVTYLNNGEYTTRTFTKYKDVTMLKEGAVVWYETYYGTTTIGGDKKEERYTFRSKQ